VKAEASNTQNSRKQRLAPPALKRLGTLQELTRFFIGSGNDAIMGGHSHA